MTALNKQALREAAEKATPGEWKRMMRNSDELMTTFHGIAIGNVFVELTTGKRDIFDAEFIAASNPATVLALLDELEKMQAQSSKWCEAFHKAVSVGARYEERIAELEAKLDSADKLQDSAFRHGLQHGFSLGQTDNQAGFEECLSAYGTGKGE
ncbi:ead/Ea22-like family protein [Escherichia coli]|uniref:ead/Ea22-like family protein n=1 Tax=Escherichia coli TaxID=562 RepID=UPI000DD8863B|nr:ead/Ea22-like family protein [Escherichia coli]